MAHNKAQVYAAYDLQTKTFDLVAWLETDGEIDAGATACTVRLYPKSAPTVAVPAVAVLIPTPQTPGQFILSVAGLTLDVGAPYFAKVTITDTGMNVRESGAALVIL